MSNTSPDKAIRFEVEVAASARDVWKAWTTPEGITSFFAPACEVEARVGGPYELYFMLDAEPGTRGSEGAVILALQEDVMLSFTWNAPPHLPEVRAQQTHVVLRLSEAAPGRTSVHLTHDGWGEGGQWDEAFDYFVRAWGALVVPRLVHRFEVGPIDWDAPPELPPVSPR